MTMSPPSLSLDGVRVLDLSRVLAGPFCGMLLSDLGADVVKIEDTGAGDESRTWPPHKDGESAAFLVINRNKRDMTLDLKAPEGVAVLERMVATADVLIENFRTGTMESFGLGYDRLAAINPRLVYCSVSAFGRTGPRKDAAGYEALMQAFSGIMSITGEPDGAPLRCGVSFLDLTTGIFCAFGIVNALLHRERTGLGQRRGLPADREPAQAARLLSPLAVAVPHLQVPRRPVDFHRRRQRPVLAAAGAGAGPARARDRSAIRGQRRAREEPPRAGSRAAGGNRPA
jgi:crotonobetainyl-CoA:carnitine CoA-transferase CaiB-like acyl-CoA transferase